MGARHPRGEGGGGPAAAMAPRAARTAAVLAGLTLLPGCVVIPVPAYHDGTAAGAGAALGAMLGATVDLMLPPLPPPGAVWDPDLRAWRLP